MLSTAKAGGNSSRAELNRQESYKANPSKNPLVLQYEYPIFNLQDRKEPPRRPIQRASGREILSARINTERQNRVASGQIRQPRRLHKTIGFKQFLVEQNLFGRSHFYHSAFTH